MGFNDKAWCPLISEKENDGMVSCVGSACAWHDSSQCAVFSILEMVGEIKRGVERISMDTACF
jgi:hypothetical protein